MNTMETAPKDQIILLDVDLPYLVCGYWNQHEEEWVYATLEFNRIGNGDFADPYFGNEYEPEPKGWLPLPTKETNNARSKM